VLGSLRRSQVNFVIIPCIVILILFSIINQFFEIFPRSLLEILARSYFWSTIMNWEFKWPVALRPSSAMSPPALTSKRSRTSTTTTNAFYSLRRSKWTRNCRQRTLYSSADFLNFVFDHHRPSMNSPDPFLDVCWYSSTSPDFPISAILEQILFQPTQGHSCLRGTFWMGCFSTGSTGISWR
jgi:hypothetical protein